MNVKSMTKIIKQMKLLDIKNKEVFQQEKVNHKYAIKENIQEKLKNKNKFKF